MRTIEIPANARSRRTRSALLDAARTIIETEGFTAMTMATVADRAGVSRRSVYLHFASRTDLVTELFRHIVRGLDLDVVLAPVWKAPNAEAALAAWGVHMWRTVPTIVTFSFAHQFAAAIDADAREHRRLVVEAQYTVCRRLAAQIAQWHRLAEPWNVDMAADLIFAQMASQPADRLINERSWSTQEYGERMALMLSRTLLTPRP